MGLFAGSALCKAVDGPGNYLRSADVKHETCRRQTIWRLFWGKEMNQLPIIHRRSLHDEIAVRLRDMLMEGDLRPGTKVPERELCELFGVSRTPMREALKVLASEGLLQLMPNRGAIVAQISGDEIAELFPIMGALEGLAAELACERMTADELAHIETLHAEMVERYRQRDWLTYTKLNRAIHEAIFAAASNQELSSMFQTLLVRTHAVRFVTRKSPERWREAVDEHEAMMISLRARDAAHLGQLMRLHLKHKAEFVNEAQHSHSQQAKAT